MTRETGGWWTRIFTSLRTRLILFLSVALLPLGGVAVYQTIRVIEEAGRLADRDVLARTVRAAGALEATLLHGYGAADALGTAAAQMANMPAACSELMGRFVDAHPDYVFAGFIGSDGLLDCSSVEQVIDYNQRLDWQNFVANPRPLANVRAQGAASGLPVLVVFMPVFDPDTQELVGGQALSMPQWLTRSLLDAAIEGVDLAILDADGVMLSASEGLGDIEDLRGLDLRPGSMDIPPNGVLVPMDDADSAFDTVSLVPLIGDRIYVVGLWSDARRPAMGMTLGGVTPVFPLLMWLSSLIVAFLAVDALVLRHLSRLSARMARFRSSKDGARFDPGPTAPGEIRDIAATYNTMIDRIMSDRSALERSLGEQELLLREVHHRVKNNLQLIASILNMQRRSVKDAEARRILGRVQDRVMSLSTIHKALYTGARVDSVRADLLLKDIVVSVLDVGVPAAANVERQVDLAEVTLDPDQAVPLSLLATEALTNAAKHLSVRETDGRPRISVALTTTDADPGRVSFSVVNTCGETIDPADASDGTELGAKLIEAFASQLGGTLDTGARDGEFHVHLTFEKLPTEDTGR